MFSNIWLVVVVVVVAAVVAAVAVVVVHKGFTVSKTNGLV
jgi:hypothetical protein